MKMSPEIWYELRNHQKPKQGKNDGNHMSAVICWCFSKEWTYMQSYWQKNTQKQMAKRKYWNQWILLLINVEAPDKRLQSKMSYEWP